MKVIHVNWSLPIGGKERRLIQLIKGLNHNGYDQTFLKTSFPSSMITGEVDAHLMR